MDHAVGALILAGRRVELRDDSLAGPRCKVDVAAVETSTHETVDQAIDGRDLYASRPPALEVPGTRTRATTELWPV